MKIRMTFDIPKEANKWLRNYNNCFGTKVDWETVIDALFTAFLEDIQSDYDNSLEKSDS